MRIITAIVILLFFTSSNCKPVQRNPSLELLFELPKSLKEASGMTLLASQRQFYVINDSGNPAVIYGLDKKSGAIKQEISLTNGKNVDWEDTAFLNNDLFIGDFGNNGNLRRNLAIYWIPDIDKIDGKKGTAFAKAITFTLEDQTKFPPKKKDRNFDIESLIAKDNFLYMFTRNRSKNFDGTVKCYKLPIIEGKHIAKLIGSFKTGKDESDCQVTAAAYHAASNKVALLSYNKVWILEDFEDDHFFEGTITEHKLGDTSQKEALLFENEDHLIIGEETTSHHKGKAFRFKLN